MKPLRPFITTFFWVLIASGAGAKNGKLNIIVDERMEMLTTIQYLSGYPVLTQANISYKKDIDAYFEKFKDHGAVVLYSKIFRRFLAFDAAPTYLYHFSFPDLKQTSPFSREEIDNYGFYTHRDTLTLLLKEFKDFYEATQFHRFYTDHSDFYSSLVKPVRNKIAPTDIINVMEEYYGQKNKEYNIVLSPLLHDGGYGPQITTPGGNVLYAIVGPKFDSNEQPEFDIDNLLSEYVIHEFSHSFCNPLIARNKARLAKDSCLLIPILGSQKKQGYGSWETCVIEHFVRANEIMLTEKVFGREKAAEATNGMIKNDQWIYLEGLIPILKLYNADRKKYKNQNGLMPMVVAYFDRKAKACK